MAGWVAGQSGTADLAMVSWTPPHADASPGASISAGGGSALVATGNLVDATKSAPARTRRLPRLPRISSDCDPEDEIMSSLRPLSEDLYRTRQEFDDLHRTRQELENPASLRRRRGTGGLSRYGRSDTVCRQYFKSQTEGDRELHISADPEAPGDAEIVVDAASASIYDAYLLTANISRNVNSFQRLRVEFSSTGH